jgi:hypothetical protein
MISSFPDQTDAMKEILPITGKFSGDAWVSDNCDRQAAWNAQE